jgi:hypothetical protein
MVTTDHERRACSSAARISDEGRLFAGVHLVAFACLELARAAGALYLW